MTRHVLCLIREQPHYRRDAFRAGLEAADCKLVDREPRYWRPGEVLVIWNRYGQFHQMANRCEAGGGIVLVAENGYLGRDWNGGNWYALSRSHHNGAGEWLPEGPERWDSWGVSLLYRRERRLVGLMAQADPDRRDVVLLPQRGIGPPGVAMPAGWVNRARKAVARYAAEYGLKVRVREHPGERPSKPLDEDLQNAALVVTWGSGAALKAMLMDIPCAHQFDRWIGASASWFLTDSGEFEGAEDYGRLGMFRRLAWAMWTVEELATGLPFRRLLT